MENKDHVSWSSAPIYQSQWLQTTISDLDERLGAMMSTLEDANSPNRGQIEDLMQMIEDFGRSYRVLAIAHSQLKSKTSQDTFHSGSLSSTISKTICASCNRSAAHHWDDKKTQKTPAEHSAIEYDGTKQDFEISNKQEDECHHSLSSDPRIMKFKQELEGGDTQIEDKITGFSTNENTIMQIEGLELNQRIEDSSVANFKFDNMWSMLKCQMTKLTEDNVHQLVELAQRNDEKRETIRRLQLEVETLKCENKALQISSRHSNADSECNQSQISIPGRMSMSKLFRGCSP